MDLRNRTLFHGDNLDFLRGVNSNTVHLIATDPPFNKGKDFHATYNKLAAGARFKDRWKWETDVHDDSINLIRDDWPVTWAVIQSTRQAYDDDMAAFLVWLGVRLIEMHRILKPDGSMYLHIDYTAHAYVKILMDSIFGARNFRNEIVWCYSGGGIPRQDFPRKHDTLLRYSKSSSWTFNVQRKPYKSNTQNMVRSRSGKRTKIDLERGTPVTDWWTDIPTTAGWSAENVGFPTQKPVGLYSRIIEASSDTGDMVLDPFCGSGTVLVAAERVGRRWVGVDSDEVAVGVARKRLRDESSVARLF